ncbi:ATP-binding protein [Dyadobacter sp. CY326]|uniref:ATP-binding protein n=1 Tax=Dyadobacter sp. CY326 TaxID=2907300 RepID=UPI001F48A826|nr:ATP-binding protein [Dyadobacter sp. CY326]MCE7064963.1 ATP-binding protein [Dyadobacter sp. CY326]
MKKLILICALASSLNLAAQKPQTPLHAIWQKSLPFITNYVTDDYKAALQNWALLQADNGIVYAANNSGVLEFDGTTWRLIKTTEGSPARSMAKTSSGRIFVGGSGEVGYLAANAQNEIVFYSLKNKLDSANWDFGNVWFTYARGNSVFFICDQYILKWDQGKFSVWKSNMGTLGFAWMIRETLYVSVSGKGLMKLEGNGLALVEGGADFKGMGLTGLLPYSDNQLLAIGLNKQFKIYDGHSLRPFAKDGKAVEIIDAVYHGVRLSNGDYALATTGSGFYLRDHSGNIKSHISRKDGLPSDAIYAAFEDAEGDVWLATDNGISRLEINAPLRILNANHGLDENPFDIEFFNGKIYATNSKGLFELNQSAGNGIAKLSFSKIKGVDNLTMHCQKIGEKLIVSNYDGVFSLDKMGKLSMIMRENVVRVEESRGNAGHLFVGLEGPGITELLYADGQWKKGEKRTDIKAYAESFIRAANGNVFINTRRSGIFEMAWKDPAKPKTLSDSFNLIHHNVHNGLSSNTIRSMESVDGKIYVSTDHAMHRFNPAKHTFETDKVLTAGMKPYEGGWINEIVEGRDAKMWFTLYHNYQSHVFKYQNNALRKLPVSGRFSDALISKVYDSGAGITMFGSNKGIVLFDEDMQVGQNNPFKTLIRRVLINKDSLLDVSASGSHNPEIEYGHDGLRFQFALPSYDLSSKNEFQYDLEGFNAHWSAWSTESMVDFTNLSEGDYVFRVRGRNVYGEVGAEARLAFTILPPWYRTWWAYAMYVLLLAGLTMLIIRIRERKLKMEKQQLENTIRERTEKIMTQTAELQEMDRVKSRFFANISHEFRTPLTLILAPLEEEIKKTPRGEREGLLIMKRYANRLVELVNQLLNLSKLEAGKMELQVAKGDLKQFLNILSSSFDSLAQHKEINFTRTIEMEEKPYWFDADKLEKIIINLLSNAFKFTPPFGTVLFNAHILMKEGRETLAVSLSDTGKGIAPDEQQRVFESFYQSRQKTDGYEGGTGLGLALVKELVKLHNGTIQLESAVGFGSVFTMEVPVSNEAFADNQLITKVNGTLKSKISNGVIKSDETQTETIRKIKIDQEPKDSVLIAEDNNELRDYMAILLEGQFVVHKAANGAEALEMARCVMPSLIISDLMMPVMDGIELTSQIKSDVRTSHIPVILLTAKGGQESRIDGLKTGADDYLTKPFSIEELSVRVRNLIDLRKKLAERYRERIRVQVTPSTELSIDDKFLMKAKHVVEANMEDVSFSVEKMAEEMNLGRTQLLRKMKALTGQAPTDFIRDLRLQKAAEMIRQKADTITQIGYAVGFNDQSYFSKCFKKEYGETPTEYSLRVSKKNV